MIKMFFINKIRKEAPKFLSAWFTAINLKATYEGYKIHRFFYQLYLFINISKATNSKTIYKKHKILHKIFCQLYSNIMISLELLLWRIYISTNIKYYKKAKALL